MPCYHPLKAYQVGFNENGKKRYAISKLKQGDDLTDFILIPCGQCIGCRIDYARQWADRCMLEAQEHETNYFLTLTYDEDHMDTIMSSYDDDGIEKPILTLNKRDLQLFLKRLRKELDIAQRPKIRFFACGEYGSPEHSMRPHFHLIVFGLKLTDLKFYKYNKLNQPLYTSDFLAEIWKNGYVIVGDVTWESCAYVSRYVTKKLKGDASYLYKAFNIIPPYTVMSRKPGIAYNYYDNHPELFDYSYISLASPDGSKKIYPPRYFKKKLQEDDPERYEEIRDRLQMSAQIVFDSKNMVSDLDPVDQLELEESLFSNRVRTLVRKEV